MWSRTLQWALLAGAAGFGVASAVACLRGFLRPDAASRRVQRALTLGALTALAAALVAGGWTQGRLRRIGTDWAAVSVERSQHLRVQLRDRLRQVFENGRDASRAAASAAQSNDGAALFSAASDVRQRYGLAAVAIFDAGGDLVAWAGEHRGVLPESLRQGARSVVYAERPLFSYLYSASPVPAKGGRAVAVTLLQTGPPLGPGRAGGEAARFEAATGASVRFEPGAPDDASWTFEEEGRPVFSATLEPASQSAARTRVAAMGRRVALALLALSFLLLAGAWIRGHPPGRGRFAVPLLSAAVVLALAPLGAVLPLQPLFSPGLFLLPAPGEVTLGPLLAVMIPLAALVALWRARPRSRRRFAFRLAAGAVLVPLTFGTAMRVLITAAGPSLLERDPYLWWGLQPAAVLLLASIAGLLFPRLRAGEDGPSEAAEAEPAEAEPVQAEPAQVEPAQAEAARHEARPPRGADAPRWPMVMGGGLVSAALGAALLSVWSGERGPPPDPWQTAYGVAALWAVPYLLLALGIGRRAARAGRLGRTVGATWLAATFVLPMLWAAHVRAELGAAEQSLSTLGSRSDPYVAYLLNRFGSDVRQRAARGDRGVDLLFRSWVASGLAEEGYPVQLIAWDALGRPATILNLAGAASPMPADAASAATLRRLLTVAEASDRTVLDMQPAIPAANQALAVPLDGAGVTAVVVPRRQLDFAPALLGFLGAPPPTDTRLTLVQSSVATDSLASGAPASWERTDRGWRAEARVRYPDGLYHAHIEVRAPPLIVSIARGALLSAVDLALLMLLWLVGRWAEGDWSRPVGGWFAWVGSFRARMTLALFAFFLIPTAAFGAFAYRALAGESVRSASLLGRQAVEQAAETFPDSNYLVSVGSRVGQEVLYYLRGELAQASSPEAVQLGLYGAWMPPSVYLALRSGEEIAATQVRQVFQTPYVMSFRALRPAGTLAVPVSLATGEGVARQRELAHLVLFATLLGGVLSLALSLLVARALSRPIAQIRRAAAAVGAGRLDVRLPATRTDEFGELFASFNRMVRRLRRARSREIRTARVLAWGEMARQVAHEIKNPLTPIKLSVQHLRRAYADRRPDFGSILDTNVEHVLTEIDRLGDIARAFSRYGLPAASSGPLERVDVSAVVRETLGLYRSGESGIVYRERLPDDLPPARARAAELKEVLVNLLENARAAIDGAGAVEVSAAALDGVVEVVVRDEGTGIPPELLPRIFEPHFSTRTAGTGLGLAIVRRLVEGWGGTVTVESEESVGAAVRVRLPRA